MSVEVHEITFVMVAVPLLAAALGIYVSVHTRSSLLRRWGGIGLAVLGPAQIAGMLLWFERGCFETWQPCGTIFGPAVFLLWLGLALVLVLAWVGFIIRVAAGRREAHG